MTHSDGSFFPKVLNSIQIKVDRNSPEPYRLFPDFAEWRSFPKSIEPHVNQNMAVITY
jgi:hypothetical protein